MNSIFKIRELGIFLTLVIVLIVFSITSTNFFTIYTFSSILSASSEIGILAIGVTILMIAGEFDLSVGVNFAFTGMVFSYLASNTHINSIAIFFIALAVAFFIGLINGILTVYARIPSFITTLGTMMMWRGILLLITTGLPITIFKNNFIINVLSPQGDYGFISGVVLWLLVVCSLGYLLKYTKLGNHIMATGGNKYAAFAMGVNVNGVKIFSFILCGILAGLGGILQCCHILSLVPQAGEGYELSAIAASVIGGTLLTGGVGTVSGTAIGIFLINVINSGLIQSGASTYWYQAIVGFIVIVAVIINLYISKKIKTCKDYYE